MYTMLLRRELPFVINTPWLQEDDSEWQAVAEQEEEVEKEKERQEEKEKGKREDEVA